MFREDIDGSLAHAAMLCAQGIISAEDLAAITDGLKAIREEIENGTLLIDLNAEDIHTFVEGELTSRVGAAGKRLHTARSRNDQVAVDIRLYLRKECEALYAQLTELISVILKKAERYADAVMPGYTHLQRAQPITFGHHLMAYAEMLLRDKQRLLDAEKRMNYCPLGACALAGTTYNTDREMTAEALGFSGAMQNSLDAVSDRDFCIEPAAAGGFINATDCADYLVGKGLPFRDAYKATGELVALCIKKGLTLETLPLAEYKNICGLFDEGVYEAINLDKCVKDRTSLGGPAPDNVRAQIKRVRDLNK